MFTKLKNSYNEFPNTFWVLIVATFIDRLGGFLLFPFFALYITEHFEVGMTEVGLMFTLFSVGAIFGAMLGGAITDKYGRRPTLLFGLITSGTGSIAMGLVNDLNVFYILAVLMGLTGSTGGPAQQAMVADLLPKEKQAEGFGIIRVAMNISATIGPALGGLLAAYSYMFLFIADAVSSLITAVVVYLVIPETKPQQKEEEPEETTVMETIRGYKEVLKDRVYKIFLVVSSLMTLVYLQMNSTLSVFLRDVHGFPVQMFGWLLSMNAIMVVLFQFWLTHKISKYAPMKMMALGTLLYAIGFGMYGFISTTILFFIAMIIITVGEMVVAPFGQSIAADFAPEDKRGRYMAALGFTWIIPNMFGVLGAGLIMDHFNPNWVWFLAGILSLVTVSGFVLLHRITKDRFSKRN